MTRDGKVVVRAPLPSAYIHDVSGFWDAGESLPGLVSRDADVPFVTIGHDLSIACDGQAYAARAYARRVEVVRLGWSRRCTTP